MSDPRQSQEEKHKLGRASSKFKDPPRIMQSDDYFAPEKFKAINGNMGPTTSLTASSSIESGGQLMSTPAVPKMGVRARVSEWPPTKGLLQELTCKTLWKAGPRPAMKVSHPLHNGQNDETMANRRSRSIWTSWRQSIPSKIFVCTPRKEDCTP